MKIYRLENNNHKISFLDYGAAIYEWINKSTNTNIILTNKDLNDYTNPQNGFFGLTVGPIANRTKDAKFEVEGITYHLEKNENNNNLHSGKNGFWNKTFKVFKYVEDEIVFKLNSSLKEDLFPGNKELFVTYKLLEDGLRMEYRIKTDTSTPVNITNHVYFNLNGKGTILDQELFVDALEYMSIDDNLLPKGLVSIKDTYLDFSTKKPIKSFLDYKNNEMGIDHHYQFTNNKFASLENDKIRLEFKTSYPGVQIYISNNPSGQLLKNNETFNKYAGITLEPQFEIDAINNNYRDIILKPNEEYFQWTEYKIINK